MTHAYLGLAAFDVTAIALGYALLLALGLVRTRRDMLRYAGLAFLGGWAAIGVAVALGVSWGVDPAIRNVLLIVAGAMAICVGVSRLVPRVERPALPRESDRLLRAIGLAGAGLVAVGLVASVIVSARAGADYFFDTWAFWLPKAKAIYFFHGLNTGLSGFLSYANPEYPPLVPATTAATFHFMGGAHPALLPLQQSLLGVAFVCSVVALLAPRVPRWILFPPLAMLTLSPGFWSRMGSVPPDQTTAYLLAVAILACLLWLDERRGALIALATLFLAAATLTKEEGFALSLVLAVAVIAGGLLIHRLRAWPSLALLLGPLAIKPWHAWLHSQGQRVTPLEYDWHDLERWDFLSARIGRLGYATHKMVDYIVSNGAWSLVIPLTLAALVLALVAGGSRVITTAVALWLAAGFMGLAAVYWIGVPEVHWYVNTSAERVVGTIPLVAGAVLPLLLALVAERRELGPGRRPGGTDVERAPGPAVG